MKKIISAALAVFMLLTLAVVPVLAESNDVVSVISVKVGNYTDLTADWYREAAEKYGYADIFDADGQFLPEKAITRMEFVRMLHRALGININYFAATDISEHFSDVKNDDAGAGDLYDFVTAGIVAPGGKFNPDKPLTREEMVGWLIAALNYKTGGDYAMILIMPAPFDDDSEIGEQYKDDVIKAVILGLIKGRGGNMLYPKDSATRAEAVVVADRLVKLIDSLTVTSGVDVTMSTQEETDGALKMTLVIQNNTDSTVAIEHTSGQHYDFKIFDASGDTLYTWSADKMFNAMVNTTEIKAGESIEFTDTLDAETYAAIKDEIVSVKGYIIGSSSDFTINTDGYEAPIA